MLRGGFGSSPIRQDACPLKERLARLHLELELADLVDGIDVLVGMFLASIHPGAGVDPNIVDRIGKCCPRDALVDCRMDDLGDRAHRRRPVKRCRVINDLRCIDCDVLEQDGAVPVVRWPNENQSSITVRPLVPRNERQCGALLMPLGDSHDPLREQRAG